MVGLDAPIITGVLRPISRDLAWKEGFAWVGGCFILAWVLVGPIWGFFSVVAPVKPVLTTANIILIIGSLLSGLSTNIPTFVTGRTLQGIGGAGVAATGGHVLHGLFPDK
jgi:MFS family permease